MTFTLKAQFIKVVTSSEVKLTTLENSRWQHFSNMASTQSISLVQLDTLSYDALAGQSFTFSIPGGPSEIEAQGRFIQQTSTEDYIFWANIANDRGYLGIASNAAGKVAYAQVDGQVYMMHLLSENYNALVKVRKVDTTSNLLPQLCPPELIPPSDITFDEICDIDNNCSAVVSVLILVTPEAYEWLGDSLTPLEGMVHMALGIYAVNFALLNSGIYHKSVKFIVEPYNFNFPNQDPDLADDIYLLSIDSLANNRRIANRADLMFLLTDSRYFPYLGGTYLGGSGLPYLGIASIEYLLGSSFVLAHEMGHTFLLNHNRVSNDGDYDYDGEFCPFGWRFYSSEGDPRRTIMATTRFEDTLTSSVALLNYSNPNIFYGGEATGTSTDFNARLASHTLCRVGDYFEDDELSVDISGPIFICDEKATYTASVTPPGSGVSGVGPYNIRWGVCASEFPTTANPMVPLGSTNPLTISSGEMPNPEFWLLVSVTSSDGVFMDDIIHVDNACESNNELTSSGDILPYALNYKLTPNPVNQYLQVQFFEQVKDIEVGYSISNSLGQVILSGVEKIGFQNQLDIDLRSKAFSDGLYYLCLESHLFSGVQKFLYQQ